MLAGVTIGVMPAWSAVVDSVGYGARITAWKSSGDFAPHYMAANRYGTLTMASGTTLALMAGRAAASSAAGSEGEPLWAWEKV